MCISTAQARTNRVSRRPLTKPSCHFVRVGSLSLWRGANFEIARATFSALRASRIPVVVARCEFLRSLGQPSQCRIPLVVARCEFLRSLAQPSQHFVRVGSLSLWRGANFEIARATFSALRACRIPLVVARCEFLRSLAQPSQHFVRVGSLSLWRGANF